MTENGLETAPETAIASMSVPERSASERTGRRRGWNARLAAEVSARVRRAKAESRRAQAAALAPWGSIGDPNSKLGRLAADFERELVVEYDVSRSLWAERVRSAAEPKAFTRRAKDLLGIDPKVTLRQITAAAMAAERLLNKVPRIDERAAEHETGADLVERVNREIEHALARERGDG